ncbi:TolC family protein [Colwellia sp. PAMC 21821]|uniref:TolC family protein n=1 Tax=Colwellia sp. PAMC 21821 TaxID=1816219 RepID=UPI0009BE005D|nr:TolC family protein [Colwellia sp. PAMC 21821]
MFTLALSGYAYSEVNTLKSIDLSTAISQTMNMHPELKVFANQADIYQGYVQQAGIQSRPEIGLTIEDAMGTGDHGGFKSAQSTLSISWVLDNSLAKSRVQNAKVQGATVALEREIKALDLAAQTARYFIQVLVNEERLKLAKLSLHQANSSFEAVTQRVKAGKSSLVDKLKSKAEVAKRALVVEDLNHEVDASKYQLLAQWQGQGQAEQYKETKIIGSLLSLPNIALNNSADVDALFTQIKKLPAISLFATKQRIAQSEIELARIETKPLWKFSTGFRRYETTDDFGLVAGVSIPFGDRSQNQGKINALRATQSELAAESLALVHRLNTQLYVLIEQMKHSQHVIHAVTENLIPVLEQAFIEAEKAYKVGMYSYTEWMNTQQELLNTQSDLIDAYQSAHLNNIEIERLTGASLVAIHQTDKQTNNQTNNQINNAHFNADFNKKSNEK